MHDSKELAGATHTVISFSEHRNIFYMQDGYQQVANATKRECKSGQNS